MVRMTELIDVKNKMVNQSLRAICRFGWDSIEWQGGYSCLHYAAECMDNPGIVEVLGLFAPDINARDAAGKRPLDYARSRGMDGNVKAIEKLRSMFFREKQAERAVSESQKFAEFPKMVEILEHIFEKIPESTTPALRSAVETVLSMGWKNIVWPNKFTAIHLAAQCGNFSILRLLLEDIGPDSKKDFDKKDDAGNRPIDYAKKDGFDRIVEYLKKYDPSKGSNDNLQTSFTEDQQKAILAGTNALLQKNNFIP